MSSVLEIIFAFLIPFLAFASGVIVGMNIDR